MSLGSVKAQNMALDANYGTHRAANWPGTIWVHLFAGDPTIGAAEINGGGYAPVSVPNIGANFPDATGGLKVNGSTIDFPVSTGAWSAPATFLSFSDAQFALPAPVISSVSNVGTAGATNWQYVVTTLNADGETTASGIGVTTTGNATLTGSNYNTIAWGAVAGATGYNVYRLVGSTFVFIGTTASTSFNDTGMAPTTQTPPISNTTMTLLDGGPVGTPIRVLAAGVIVGFPPSTIVIGD